MNEKEIAKENVKGCSKKGLGISGFKCGYYRGTFCDECNTKINTHFASCQRFLEFVMSEKENVRFIIYEYDALRDCFNVSTEETSMGSAKESQKARLKKHIDPKLKDLKNAIKIYGKVGIKVKEKKEDD